MAESLNLDLLSVAYQNTEKIAIQDWLDGNNFSQTSSSFEPLVVYADVHYSASGVGKPSQSDIDEDFVSVSQILSRKKLTKPVKKKFTNNICNFDAIEPYTENKVDSKFTNDNDPFDIIFHKGEKVTNVIKRTYPGKVKNKMVIVGKRSLRIQKNLFTNSSSENNKSNGSSNVSECSVEKDKYKSKVDFSSGSGELWSPTQHNFNTRSANKLTIQRLVSHKICKKYLKNKVQHKDKQKFKDKVTKINEFQATNNVKKSRGKQLNSVKRSLNRTIESSGSKNKMVQSEKLKDCSDVAVNNENILKSTNSVKVNNISSCVTLPSNQICERNNAIDSSYLSFKPNGMSYEEFKKIINNKPIVLAEPLVYPCQNKEKQELNLSNNVTQKSLKMQSTCTKKHLNRENTKSIFNELNDSCIPNDKNESFKVIVNKTKVKKMNTRHNILEVKHNITSCIQYQAVDTILGQNTCLNNISNHVRETLVPESSSGKSTSNSGDFKPNDPCTNVSAVEELPELQSKTVLNDESKNSFQKSNIETKANIVSTDKKNLKTLNQTETHCESTALITNNDLIKRNKNKNKRSLRRKVKPKKNCQSTTSNLECNTTTSVYNKTTPINVNIKKLAEDKIKKVPLVLVKPVNVCDNETQIITDRMISQVNRFDKRVSNSNCETSLCEQFECNVENLQEACNSKEKKKELVTPIKVSEQKSPGWSRLEKIKRVFNTLQKPQLNVSIGSKMLRSFNKVNLTTSDSSCQIINQRHDTSPILKSKTIVKHLFKDKNEKIPLFNIHEINDGKLSHANQRVSECKNNCKHSVFKNSGYKSEEEITLNLKRKCPDLILDICRNEKSEKLENNYKRQKFTTVSENACGSTLIHNTLQNIHSSIPKVKNNSQKTVSTMTETFSKDIGIQTNPEIYCTNCLQLLEISRQKQANISPKKCISPIIFDSESDQLFNSDKLTKTLEHISEQTKDSAYFMPSCKIIVNRQDINNSSCMQKDFLLKNNIDLTEKNNSGKFNLNHDNKIIGKEENPSTDLFLDDTDNILSKNIFNNARNCLYSLCKPNIFCDQIPFKKLNSIESISLDFSQNNKYSENILNSKKNGQVRDKISFTCTNNTTQCNQLPESNVNNKICDNLNLNQMNEIKTDYFLGSSRSLVNGKNPNSSALAGNNIQSPVHSSDFIQDSFIHNLKNNRCIVENIFRNVHKLGSHSDNESMASLSTVVLDDVNYTSFGTGIDFDVVVSDLGSESCEDKNISLKNTETNTDVDLFGNTVSESIQHIEEFTNEICHSNKDSSWSRNNLTVVPVTGCSELPNTINTSLLTEILNTQQQKNLREECIQLEAQIKTMQKELVSKKEN